MSAKKQKIIHALHLEQLQNLDAEIWTAYQEYQKRFLGNIGLRMTVIRLANNELFIHAPIELTEEIRRDLIKLGTPRYLIASIESDSQFLTAYQAAFPSIKIFGTPSLLKKRGEINFYGTLSSNTHYHAWADEIDQHFISNEKNLEEIAFFHRQSRSIVVANLFCNFPSASSWFQKKARQFFANVCPGSGENTSSFIAIPRRTQRILRKVAGKHQFTAWLERSEPVRIVMNHGIIFEGSAKSASALLGE